jgi:hypothetical protein
MGWMKMLTVGYQPFGVTHFLFLFFGIKEVSAFSIGVAK